MSKSLHIAFLGIATAFVNASINAGAQIIEKELAGQVAESELSFGAVPLGFEENKGQFDSQVRFMARGAGYSIFLTSDEIVLALATTDKHTTDLHMSLVDAEPTFESVPLEPLNGKVNYLIGRNPDAWHVNVPTYKRVMFNNVYEGIDLVCYGNQRKLEYDFVVAPGKDPNSIGIAFNGHDNVSIGSDGNLQLSTPAGVVRQHAPIAYQEIEGKKLKVDCSYVIDDGIVRFLVGDYDATIPLVIDPVLEWSTFLGGATSYDWCTNIDVDDNGFVYVVGYTFSSDFPTTSGAADTSLGVPGPNTCAPGQDAGAYPEPRNSCFSDTFISKFSPDGTSLIYSTYIGGTASDRAFGLAVDSTGAAFISGGTDSPDFPTTKGAVDTTFSGQFREIGLGLVIPAEGFVAKLSPDGSSLDYSTYLGGTLEEEAVQIEIDSNGNAYVTGQTFSDDFPTTVGAYDTDINEPGPDESPGSFCDVFVTKLNSTGTAIEYSTFAGGSRIEFLFGATLDEAGSVYVVGDTSSPDIPVTPGVLGPSYQHDPNAPPCDSLDPLEAAECFDSYLMKISPNGASLEYATYIGGSDHEHAHSVVVRNGEAYIAGHTFSDDFPTTPGAFQETLQGDEDGFVARISDDASSLIYSTILGGTDGADFAFDIDVDDAGVAYVVGITGSSDFPTSQNAFDRTFAGAAPCTRAGGPLICLDGFFCVLSADGSSQFYSTYLGGTGPEIVDGIVLHNESAYVAGATYSPEFPTTAGSYQSFFGGPVGYSDGFITKFADVIPVPESIRLEDCIQQIGVFPIDASEVEPYLPPGFTPIPFQDSSPFGGTGIPAPQNASATVQLIATTGTPATGQALPVEPMTIAQAWIYADPPENFEDPAAGPTPSPYVCVPVVVVTNDILAFFLESWGLPAIAGVVSNDITEDPIGCPGANQIGQLIVNDGSSVVTLDTSVLATVCETTPEHLRLFGVRRCVPPTGSQLSGMVDFIEDAHTHHLIGDSTLTVNSGTPGFPVPTDPGVALHVQSGYGLTLAPVTRCLGDIAPVETGGDGSVSVDDLAEVFITWGSSCSPADIDGNGIVDVDDLGVIFVEWGPCN